jgi:hypothetical protein
VPEREPTSAAVVTVAALYVDECGTYSSMPGVDPWPLTRNAKTYAGPWSVVAHPPCGPWSFGLRFLCTKQDPECALRAVDAVRAFGGVLEHPKYSVLWRACRLPYPGELPDRWGGRSYEVNQVSWGHCCEKKTWLYVVGVDPYVVDRGIRTGGTPTHRITSGPNGPKLPSVDKRARSATPPAFASWLVSLAQSAQR